MSKERMPRSQKSNRGHDHLRGLYAKKSQPAVTPELASRAPRHVVQSTTPSSGETTTADTPTKTPKKKGNRPQQKKSKWSHVPSASDGEKTHFENFENEGGAQLAVAKMKTRQLQWKAEETQMGTVDGTVDTGESYRQELTSDGTTGSGSGGELRLQPTELTQDDDRLRDEKRDVTQEEPDQKEVRQDVGETIPPPPPVVASKEPTVVNTPVNASKEIVRQIPSSGEKKTSNTVKMSTRENKKSVTPLVPPPTTNVTVREKRSTGGKKEGVEPTSTNYLLAVKLMKILKRNNYLENSLRFEDSEKVRKHFETVGFNQPPPPHILSLLNRAMDFVLETVLFRAEDLDTCITNDLRVFIIKKQEARESMLEVIFHRPDLMPNKWGGARVETKRSKNSKSREGGRKGWFSSFFR